MVNPERGGAGPEIVIALYRPHAGKEEDLLRIVRRHVPTLQSLGLATARAPVLARTRDGTLLEVFEWASAQAAQDAHHRPEVAALWEAMAGVADFVRLGDLGEASTPFPHFAPVS